MRTEWPWWTSGRTGLTKSDSAPNAMVEDENGSEGVRFCEGEMPTLCSPFAFDIVPFGQEQGA